MPLARIDLIAGKPPEYRKTICDVVYNAMVNILECDRFSWKQGSSRFFEKKRRKKLMLL